MKKHSSLYWICQISGWFSYGLTILFFASILDKELNPIFYPRLLLNLSLGILITHILRESMHRFSLRPPMPSNQWWKLVILLLVFSILNSFSSSYLADIFKLYEPGRNIPASRRFLFSLIFDTPIFLVWMSVYVLWHYIEFTNSEEIKKVKLETMIKDLELKTIKSQINPHFIFNALNSIRALVDENPERARQAITELSNILRSSIQVDKVEVTSLEKELDIVKDYLALEYIRFADRLKVVYEVDQKTLSNQIPPMMLQTLVENAIKHGLGKQPGDCTIKIISKLEQDKLVLMVQNTGLLQQKEKDGFGLQSTRERLNILYRGQALFEIFQCEPNQVTAKLVIPIS
ncbi:MAG: histidine kinase [Bacteroidetes bacterium]|jgi:two-component system LytT family sensor kinase|nr:histidine kinase [Bacteroidota bacterium]